jgi:hypothetical protein
LAWRPAYVAASTADINPLLVTQLFFNSMCYQKTSVSSATAPVGR